MKYEPWLPTHNDNISHHHPLREFFLLLSGILVFVALAFWSLGMLVDSAIDYIPPEKEAQLFANVDFNLEFPSEDSSDRQTFLQNLIDGLGRCINLPFPITMTVIESDQANAIALPGGKVMVFSGIFDHVKSENGLTFMLAHELGHFKSRDHLRGLGRGLVLAALSTVLLGANSNISQMLASTSEFQGAQYSQSRESQADLKALHALNCYYGHVGGATELFEVLQEQKGQLDLSMWHYFSSHPELQARIDDLHRWRVENNFPVSTTKKLKD